ncbi:MAG: T9SS type A sorting domain-containing protein [Sphingobacteriales bacterium]|nr:MAG: T9SS type A sorting domain-containing protein [Sphingobacteriales bacterium]
MSLGAELIGNPDKATDTQLVWAPYFRYVFDAKGKKTDSVLIAAEKTLTQQFRDYYKKYERINRFEIGRYITPYGNGLDLGNGFTWTFDVSDYRTLLKDSVHLAAGNWQELLNMEFLMIKGTPPRDIISIRNLWNGNFNYGIDNDPIDNHLKPITVEIPAKAKAARLKSRITGHGFGGNEDCAEFCGKTHSYKVDGTKRFDKLVWRDNCAYNPVYPQGGTWIYQRANWCPGAEVWTYDFELTPYITPGKNASLDHDVENYNWNGSGSTPYYAIEDQLVTYGAPNFTLDAAVDEILAPTNNNMYARMNPVCSNPIIRIKNTGSAMLTSLEIKYGMPGAEQSVYNWSGNLKFLETAEVNLGAFAWNGSGTFMVNIGKPNGGNDEYAPNNTFRTKVNLPPVMPEKFIIELKTNNNPDESSYTLKDASGKVIISRDNLDANTTYKDTVSLTNGCYEFRLKDLGEDGLKWWANTAQGSGTFRFKKIENGSVLKNFNTDFGAEIFYPFTVGKLVGVRDYIFESKTQFHIYPNPSSGQIHINLDFAERKTGILEITDITGRKIFSYHIKNTIAEGIEADLKHFPAGVYMAVLKIDGEIQTRKFVIAK